MRAPRFIIKATAHYLKAGFPMLKPRFDPLRFTRQLGPSQEERRVMIAEAAYRRAQTRGLQPGHELHDWLAAEAEIDFEISFRYVTYQG